MNYPGGVKIKQSPPIKGEVVYANRGMNLERDINITNEYYRNQDLAFIYKKPTPIKISKVDYSNMRITEAFFEAPSTTDYNGLYNGFYIDFEAKEVNTKTSFPLKNIHLHQIKHMKNILKHKGICFLIVRFVKFDETYLLFARDFFHYINNNSDKSSIPYPYFKEHGYLIEQNYHARVDYLKILKKYGGLENGTKETNC